MNRTLHLPLALMTILGTGCAAQQAGGGAPPDPVRTVRADPGAAPMPPREGTFEWHTYTGEGGTRRYKLFVPASYRRGRPAPLVVMLHGCTQDPDDFARGTRFNQIADSAGVLVAYPEQTAAENPQKCWSWWDPAHRRAGSGQAAQIAGITREVMARHAIDPARVYVAGISAGGAMAMNVAVSHPTLYAAVGMHSGLAYAAASDVPGALQAMRHPEGSPTPFEAIYDMRAAFAARGRPFPLIALHGEDDPVVGRVNTGYALQSWARAQNMALGVDEDPVQQLPDVAPVMMGGLAVRAEQYPRIPAVAMVIAGLGHAWSGGSPEGTYTDPRGPDASREMLRFFLANPMR